MSSKTVPEGIALNLEDDNVGIVLMGQGLGIQEGSTVRATGKIASVPSLTPIASDCSTDPLLRRAAQVVQTPEQQELGSITPAASAAAKTV